MDNQKEYVTIPIVELVHTVQGYDVIDFSILRSLQCVRCFYQLEVIYDPNERVVKVFKCPKHKETASA